MCARNTVDHIVALRDVLAAEKTWVLPNARNAIVELDRAIAFTSPAILVADHAHASRLAVGASVRLIHTGRPRSGAAA